MNELAVNTLTETPSLDFGAIKARQKSTWETGDFGQVAKCIVPVAEEFMSRLPLSQGMRVLDVACGTGNLATIAARRGCVTSGLDLASNLVAQARDRAAEAGLAIDYTEGDAEDMPYEDESFDAVVSMFGAMFTPRPEVTASELMRVTRPGGLIAMANWTPQGFIGKMFEVFGRHVPPPAGLPSPLMWGKPSTVGRLFQDKAGQLKLTRRMAMMRFPFDPAGTVEFFRKYYGPTQRAFAALPPRGQAELRRDLEQLQSDYNCASRADETETPSEYLEVRVRKMGED